MHSVHGTASNDNRLERSLLAPVNKVSLFGRLASDPEVRVTGNGRWIVHLLLTTEGSDDHGAGGSLPQAMALNRVVVVDDRLSRLAARYLNKGQRIQVEGQLQTRSSTDDSGRVLITTEIILSGRQARLASLDDPNLQVT